MKPPDAVLVAPRRWAVDLGDPGLMDGTEDGVTDFDRDRIILKATLAKGSLRDVFLHELLHAIFDQLPTKRELAEVRKDLEEDIVYALTPRLIALLRDNPKLVEYLTGD